MAKIRFNPKLSTTQNIANKNLINTKTKNYYGYYTYADEVNGLSANKKSIIRYTKDKTKTSAFTQSGQHTGTLHEYNNGSYINAYRGTFIITLNKKPSASVKFKSFRDMLEYFRENLPTITKSHLR